MRLWSRIRLLLAVSIMLLPLMLFTMAFALQSAPDEWVQYLAFSILVPTAIQLLRLLAAKGVHVVVQGWVARIASLLISVLAVYLIGGFTAIPLPVWTGDFVFVGQLLAFLVAVWSPVELMYRLVIVPIEGVLPAVKV